MGVNMFVPNIFPKNLRDKDGMTNTARTKGRKETPLYLFLLVHFATTLVEDGLIVHQFVLTHHHTEHTESLCR